MDAAFPSSSSSPGFSPGTRQATLRDVLTVLFRRKWIVLVLPLVALAVVAYINFSKPPEYSSFSRMLLKRGARENGLEAHVTILPREEELASQVEIAKSMAVVQRAQQMLDRTPGPHIVINADRVSAGVVGESNVVDITYQAPNRDACPVVADALGRAFIEYHRQAFSMPSMVSFFQRATDSSLAELQKWRSLKEQFLKGQTLGEPEDAKRTVLQLLTQQETALEQIQTRRAQLEAQIRSDLVLDARADLDLNFMPNDQLGSEAYVVDLKRSLQNLRVRLEELRARYSDNNPQVMALQEQIGEVEKQLRREGRNHILIEQQNLSIVKAQEQSLQNSLTALHRQLEGYPNAQVRLEEMDKMIDLSEILYKDMRQRQDQARVADATSPDWVATLLIPASRAKRINKYDYVRIALAPILALAVAVGLAFFIDSLDHSIKSVREVEDILGLPVVASVPEVK